MQRKPNERTDMHYGATTDELTNGHRTPKKTRKQREQWTDMRQTEKLTKLTVIQYGNK